MEYFDKNNKKIKSGDKLIFEDGVVEEIMGSDDGDIGVMATSERFRNRLTVEIYPLSQFDLSQCEIKNK